jgi:thioredoxin 1
MGVEATVETFPGLVASGNVLVDFWGPRCMPCLALMPAVEKLEEEYEGGLTLVKVNAAENRQIARDLKVIAMPTFVLFRDGAEVERLSGNPSAADIRAAVSRLVEGGEDGSAG